MAGVVFERVDKVFPDGTRAIADCNLAVEDGELVVLVGPSGCGKSTLLRLIAGLEEVSGGTLRIGDRVANDLAPRERNVAMVFQDYALYPHMTVRGNLEFPLRLGGLARAEIDRRVAWASEVLDLGGLLDRRPRQLSGGQQQRVAMGRALVREPSVFLLDEPLSNLDAKLRVEVRAQIAELQRRLATTMLYVTHDQTEAMTLGDRVAVMDKGRILQVAPPREIYEHPACAFVAGFIGSPPMNLFPARLVRGADGPGIEIPGQTLAIPEALAACAAERASVAGDGAALRAGIRPESFRVVERDGGRAALQVRVEHVEWLGHETLAYVSLADGTSVAPVHLVARLPGMRPLERGQELRLAVDPGAIHLFDADGRSIEVGDTPAGNAT